jgi:O-antigen/teichoic acid export membrane protein
VINRFASFRMSELVIKYVGQYSETGDPQRAAAVFKVAAVFEMMASLVAFVLIWVLAPLGARYLAKDDSTAGWFVIYGLIVLVNLIAESSTGLLQIFDRFRRMAEINIAQSALTLIIISVVYVSQGGFVGVLIAYLVGKALGTLGLTVSALYEATRRWGKDWWRVPINLLRKQSGELARFAISTNVSSTLSLINKDSELLWISLLRNPIETGYYRLALSLANLLQMPVSPLPQATYPELSREVARYQWKNVQRILHHGSVLAGGYTVIASLFLIIFGRLFISYLYKPEFLPAYPALLILLAGFLVANTFYWNRTALLAIGRPDFPAKVNLVLAAFKIVGIFLLVPVFGYLVNAGLLAGSYALGVSACVWVFWRDFSSRSALPTRETTDDRTL